MAKREIGLVAGYAIAMLGSVLSLVLYARVLGPTDFGRLAVDLALVEAFQGVLFQWHRLAVVKFWASNEKTDLASYLKTHHLTWLGLTCAVAAALGIAQLVASQPLSVEWPMLFAMGIAKSAALYAQEMARAAGAGVRYAIGAMLLTIGSSIAGVIAYEKTHSIVAVLAASTAVFAATSALCGWNAGVIGARGHFKAQHLRSMLNYGLPLIPVFVAATALTRLDRPVLSQFEAPAVVGVYAAATALISNMIAAACVVIVTPAYPWLLREKEKRSTNDYRHLHARIGLLMLSSICGLSVLLYCARALLLPLLLGKAIGVAAQPYVLLLLAIAIVGAFRSHYFDQAYHLFSKTRALMAINLATLAIAVSTIYFGASLDGLNGLLWGLLIANALSIVASATFARSFVNLKQLIIGGALLTTFSVVAVLAGHFAAEAWSSFVANDRFASIVSTAVAMLILACAIYLANVGGIRSMTLRRP